MSLGPSHRQQARMWAQIARRTTRHHLPFGQRMLHALGRHPRFVLGRRGSKRCVDCGRSF